MSIKCSIHFYKMFYKDKVCEVEIYAWDEGSLHKVRI